MGAIRAILLKSFKHPNKLKAWPIGKIISGTPQFISDLINDRVAKEYKGDYPPKKKTKTDFFKPKNGK